MVHAFYDVSLYCDSEAAVRAVAMQKEGPGFLLVGTQHTQEVFPQYSSMHVW